MHDLLDAPQETAFEADDPLGVLLHELLANTLAAQAIAAAAAHGERPRDHRLRQWIDHAAGDADVFLAAVPHEQKTIGQPAEEIAERLLKGPEAARPSRIPSCSRIFTFL